MDSRDLRNLSEAWDNITSSEFEVLDEAPMTAFQAGGGSAALAASAQRRNVRGGRTAMVPTKTRAQIEAQGQQNLYKAGGGDAAIRASAQNRNVRGGGTRQVPTLTRQDIINRGAVAAGSTPKPAAPVRPAPAKPVAPASTAKPAPTSTAKPAAPASTAKPAPTATAKPAPTAAAPARRSLAQDLADLRAMRAASQMRQQGKKLNGKIPTGADVQAASQSVSDLNKGARQYMQQDVDIFDIVKGHLMSEGYADTEEAALTIMANMSEEWRQSIVEEYGSIGANEAGYALQKIKERRFREEERKKIEQEKQAASSQVKGV